MNQKPLVSVICLTYNHEKYIRKCLDGFVMQKTSFPFEVLVHDDASTDGTTQIIQEYTKRYPELIKPIFQSENQWRKIREQIIPKFVLPVAEGEWIAHCEGDDYWIDVDKLQKQYDAMQKHPECSLCVHYVDYVTEAGHPMNLTCPQLQLDGGIMTPEEFISNTGCFFHLSSFFYRKADAIEFYQKDLQFKRLSDVGDKPLMLYLGQLGNVCFLETHMSCYRQNSISGWTTGLGRGPKSAVIRHLQSIVDTLKAFDEETDGRFHKQLCPIIHRAEFDVAKWVFPYRAPLQKQFRDLYALQSQKAKIRLWMMAAFPHFMPAILERRNKT